MRSKYYIPPPLGYKVLRIPVISGYFYPGTNESNRAILTNALNTKNGDP